MRGARPPGAAAFEALRPRHEVMRGQADGSTLDLDALVRLGADLRAGSGSLERVHLADAAAGGTTSR